MTAIVPVTTSELFALVDERRVDVRAFVEWAERHETGSYSMYLAKREDIADAREAAPLYPEGWWGVVVFTCFGSLTSTRTVREVIPQPIDPITADHLLASISFSRPKVGHHRIQQGLGGAKKALVAACGQRDLLYDVVDTGGSFDDRYQRLRGSHLNRWGRTTCFDFPLRTGALGIGGQFYEPEFAYLAGSTRPQKGFRKVWEREVADETAAWCEGLLQAWHRYWPEVVDRVGARWSGVPYSPGDLENALCIYQEGPKPSS